MLIAINPGMVTRDCLKGFRCMVQVSFAGTRLKTSPHGEKQLKEFCMLPVEGILEFKIRLN